MAFADVVRSERSILLFLDPDNGIAVITRKSEHVCPEQLSFVWDSLKQGDCLLVYQHRFRQSEWAENKRMVFRDSLGGVQEVHTKQYMNEFCFYWARKD